MLSSKLAVAVLSTWLMSLVSCGGGEDAQGEPGAATAGTTPTEARSAPANEESPRAEAPVHGFAPISGTVLRDDGYSAPELQVNDLHIRLEDGKWSWFTPNDDKQLAVLSEATRDDLAGEWFAPPAYSTLPNGELVVFTWQKQKLGVLTWSERAGEVFTEIPGAAGYAVFPERVLALAPDDIWVAASATTDHFGPDFPGCPSIIRAGVDSGVVAHFDGRRWRVLPYRANAALTGIYPREHGKVEVVADGSYLVSLDGTWEKIPGRLADKASEAGFTIEDGKVIHTRDGRREVVFAPPALTQRDEHGPQDPDAAGRQVARAVHVLPNGEVWLEVDILTGHEPYVAPEKEWQAWTP